LEAVKEHQKGLVIHLLSEAGGTGGSNVCRKGQHTYTGSRNHTSNEKAQFTIR